LQRAVAIAPDLLPAQAKLGEALLHTGDPAAALPHLELAESVDTDGSIHFQLAMAYRRTGKPELAARALTRYKELQTKGPRN
jgi:Flp pilus assembly protein TadD